MVGAWSRLLVGLVLAIPFSQFISDLEKEAVPKGQGRESWMGLVETVETVP
jgi:hypothetical protein